MKVINNKLYMGNFSLEKLANDFKTPLYVYDEQGILEKINLYKSSFKYQFVQVLMLLFKDKFIR